MGELEHKIRAEMEKLRGRCGPAAQSPAALSLQE